MPLYVNLYKNSGLLEGWINLAGGVVAGNLTWIRPGGVVLPAGFPQGFDTVVEVTGATFAQGVGYFWAAIKTITGWKCLAAAAPMFPSLARAAPAMEICSVPPGSQ